MFYRLSNTASTKSIESELGISFKYPQLYTPRSLINGLEENAVPLVTMESPKQISFGIWGILPEDYGEEWADFQNAHNTLNLSHDECFESDIWYSRAISNRRCLIVATGFFTFYLNEGEIFPFYVHHPRDKPLTIGGVYNQLEDGFITCAILVSESMELVEKLENLDNGMPLVLPPSGRKAWMDPHSKLEELKDFVCRAPGTDLAAHPISREFFKHPDPRESLLNPYDYKGLSEVDL